MTDATSNTANTSENGPNSSLIYKVRAHVSNILPNSISKWFSPSTDQNGNLRRRRDSDETDEKKSLSINKSDQSIEKIVNSRREKRGDSPPPTKRSKTNLNMDDQRATTSKHSSSKKRNFISSTPTLTTTNVGNRRKILGLNSIIPPYNFDTTNLNNRANINAATSNVIKNPSDLDTTDEELDDEEIELLKQSMGESSHRNLYEQQDNKRLKITPSTPGRFSSTTINNRSNRQELYYLNPHVEDEINNDDLLEHENLNGNTNESESDSGESANKVLSLPHRSQSSAGRINSTSMHGTMPIRSRPGSVVPARDRFDKSSGLNFSSHLQMHKSLFSDKNMSSSLNNSTTSLNSLNRRQSFNPSIYGSMSALSDSRLLNTNSPFYHGRTMYGGASAYSGRTASLMERTLRVPTQLRPTSSLSTLCSSTNSLASPDLTTSALSTTAKRILELINKSTTPLADVKKMTTNSAGGSQYQSTAISQPPLAVRKNYIRDIDSSFSKTGGTKLMTPRTPYSRSDATASSRRTLPLTSELQVPSMSQLLQMKKKLQNNTEMVRELATASKSVLNREEEYKLPDHVDAKLPRDDNKRTKKIRNKVSNTRPSKNVESDDVIEPVNLPHIPFPTMKSIPTIDLSVTTTSISTVNDENSVKIQSVNDTGTLKQTSNIQQPAEKVAATLSAESTTQFFFSKPIEIDCLSSAKNISPVKNFVFCEPTAVVYESNSLAKTTILSSNNLSPISNGNTDRLPQLKTGSCLDILKKDAQIPTQITLEAAPIAKPILSDLFKSSKFDKWECSMCMIRNDNFNNKCVACETSKHAQSSSTPAAGQLPKSIPSSFGTQFKTVNADTWECSMCLIRNKNDLVKCIACETPKSHTTTIVKQPAHTNEPKLKTIDQAFQVIVAEQGAKWECSVCMTRNDALRKKCICCEQVKPGTEAMENKSTFSFASSVTASKFNFGVPLSEKSLSINSVSDSIASNSSTVTSSSQPAKFTFGVPSPKSGSAASSTTVEDTSTFKFGKPIEKSTMDSAAAALPKVTFTFGKSTNSFGSTTTDQIDAKHTSNLTNQESIDSQNKIQEIVTEGTQPQSQLTFGKPVAKAPDDTLKMESKLIDVSKPATSGFSVIPAQNKNQEHTAVATADTPKTDTNSKELSFGTSGSKSAANSNNVTQPVTNSGFFFGNNTTKLNTSSTESAPTISSVTTTMTTTPFTFGTSSLSKTASVLPSNPALFGSKSDDEKKGGFAFTPEQRSAMLSQTCMMFTADSLNNRTSIEAISTTINSTPSFGTVQTTTSLLTAPAAPALGGNALLGNTSLVATTTNTFGVKSQPISFGTNNNNSNIQSSIVPNTTTLVAAQNSTSPFLFGGTNSTETKTSPFNLIGSPAATSAVPQSSFFSTTNTVSTTNPFGSTLNNATGSSSSSSFIAATQPEKTPNVPSTLSSTTLFNFNSSSSSTGPNFGQTSAFGSASPANNTPLPSFGTFGTPNLTSNSSTFGSVPLASGNNNNAQSVTTTTTATTIAQQSGSTFGGFSSPVPVLPTVNATPQFGSSNKFFGASSSNTPPSFGPTPNAFVPSTPAPNNMFYSGSTPAFGQPTPDSNDEPLSKKSNSSGFNTVSSTNQGAPPPYQFGSNNNTIDTKKPFSFSVATTPTFNFTATPQTNPTQLFTFGGSAAGSSSTDVFNFGGGVPEASPNAPFQFSAETNNNPFAPQPASQQRRKIRAARRTPR